MDEPTEKSIRESILQKAIDLTTGDRNATYGDPLLNLTTCANLVNAYLEGLSNSRYALDAAHMAVIMALSKISRISVSEEHMDNYVDGAAYLAIAAECREGLKE